MSTCNKPCGNGCKDFIGNEVEWTQIRSLNCNDYEYLASLEKDLERAKSQKDILRVVALAKEISRIKTLCGDTSNPTIQRVERVLGMARDRLGLQTCKVIKRSLEPCKPEAKRTMHGFQVFELVQNQNGKIVSMKTPEKPESPSERLEPLDHKTALLFHSRNQTRVREIGK